MALVWENSWHKSLVSQRILMVPHIKEKKFLSGCITVIFPAYDNLFNQGI